MKRSALPHQGTIASLRKTSTQGYNSTDNSKQKNREDQEARRNEAKELTASAEGNKWMKKEE